MSNGIEVIKGLRAQLKKAFKGRTAMNAFLLEAGMVNLIQHHNAI